MNIKELGYVVLAATDMEAWRTYATQVLGVMATDLPGVGLRLRIDERDCRILLRQSDVDRLQAIGWLVAGEEAYLQARAKAEAAGCDVTIGSSDECVERRVNGFFAVVDPAGFRHEIAWGPVVNFRERFISPVGVPRFEAGTHGVGHIVLGCNTADYDSAHRFLREVLGFGVSNFRAQSVTGQPSRFPVAWYHCDNPLQHSIALAGVYQPEQPRHGCRHIQLAVPSIDDLGMAFDRAERHGVQLASTIGRHVNDQAISFYMVTPSKFWIEYACEAPPCQWNEEIVFDDGNVGSIWGHKWLRSQ